MQLMTKKEFYKNCVPDNVKKQIGSATVAGYLSATVTFIAAFIMSMSLIIDAVFVFGLTTLVTTLKSRVAAIILFVYFLVSKIISIGMIVKMGGTATPAGIPMAAAILVGLFSGIIGTFKYQKLWKDYNNSMMM